MALRHILPLSPPKFDSLQGAELLRWVWLLCDPSGAAGLPSLASLMWVDFYHNGGGLSKSQYHLNSLLRIHQFSGGIKVVLARQKFKTKLCIETSHFRGWWKEILSVTAAAREVRLHLSQTNSIRERKSSLPASKFPKPPWAEPPVSLPFSAPCSCWAVPLCSSCKR